MAIAGQRLVFHSDRAITVEPLEVPEPGPLEVLVRVGFSHVSAGTEMNFFREHPADGPLVSAQLGYIAVGDVVAVGPGVDGYSPGDRVLTCAFHQSHWMVDLDPASTAIPAKRYILKLDPAISSEEAGFLVLADIALHGLRRARPQIDESAVVIGCGMVGQCVIQLAGIAGMYPVVAVDPIDSRLERARLSGATHTINPTNTDPVAAVREITGGAGVQAVFPCAPAPSTLQPALEMAAKRGKVSLVASIPGRAEIGLQVELLRRELSIIGTYEADMDSPSVYWPWSRDRNRRACMRLLGSGELRFGHLITHRVRPGSVESMFAAMHDPATDWMGVVIDWR